MLNLEK